LKVDIGSGICKNRKYQPMTLPNSAIQAVDHNENRRYS
jgi:hypothetical protein